MTYDRLKRIQLKGAYQMLWGRIQQTSIHSKDARCISPWLLQCIGSYAVQMISIFVFGLKLTSRFMMKNMNIGYDQSS